jgi:hypothetical protein
MSLKSLLIISSLALCITGCSKANTKEFFFGSPDGPDPFVIGSTLSPLKMLPNFSTQNLPKPKPILPLSQMPSHAQKASKILGITKQKSDTIIINKKKNIDFQAFDAVMQQNYKVQEENEYVLSNILGKKKGIDPTTREKTLEKKNETD